MEEILVQKHRDREETFSFSERGELIVELKSKNENSQVTIPLSGLRDRANRIDRDIEALTPTSWGLFLTGVVYLCVAPMSFKEYELSERVTPFFSTFLLGLAGLSAIGIAIARLVDGFKASRSVFVFFDRSTGAPSLFLDSSLPSPEEAENFKNFIEKKIESAPADDSEFSSGEFSLIDEIRELAALVDRGVLSGEEFEKSKTLLLAR